MKINLNSQIFSHIRTNRFKYIITLFILIAGLVAGTLLATKKYLMAENTIIQFHNQSLNIHMHSLFITSLIKNLRPFFIIWLSGRHVCLTPLNYIEILSKGFGLGYTISYLSLSGGIKGFAISLLSLVMQNFLLIPAILIFSVLQLNILINKQRYNKSGILNKQKKILSKYNLSIIICSIFIAIFCSLIDSYVIPDIIIPLCKIWF